MIDVEFRRKQIVFKQSHVFVANGVAHMFWLKTSDFRADYTYIGRIALS